MGEVGRETGRTMGRTLQLQALCGALAGGLVLADIGAGWRGLLALPVILGGGAALGPLLAVTPVEPSRLKLALFSSLLSPLVIAALFAALHLALAGAPPVVLDRGKPVETRAKDVAALLGKGVINESSNLCYGEGGAGTWSDGKLYTRVGGALLRPVLEKIVELGGPERILVDGRPHLGTDRLVKLLKAFRAHLVDSIHDRNIASRQVGCTQYIGMIGE